MNDLTQPRQLDFGLRPQGAGGAILLTASPRHQGLSVEKGYPYLELEVKAENHGRHIQGILAALNELLEMTRQGDFGDGSAALSAFDRAFGPKPTGRGMDIFDLLCALSPALQISSGKVKPEEAAMPPTEERARISARLSGLLEMEMERVRRYDESHRLLHIEITPAERGSTLGPVQAHAATMIRQEESLARQLERDIRLLRWLNEKPSAAW